MHGRARTRDWQGRGGVTVRQVAYELQIRATRIFDIIHDVLSLPLLVTQRLPRVLSPAAPLPSLPCPARRAAPASPVTSSLPRGHVPAAGLAVVSVTPREVRGARWLFEVSAGSRAWPDASSPHPAPAIVTRTFSCHTATCPPPPQGHLAQQPGLGRRAASQDNHTSFSDTRGAGCRVTRRAAERQSKEVQGYC